jgi:leader peptidase (prepilin peptidase)/N-methyltransferase
MQLEYILILTVVLLYGLVIGSFLNVCIYRIPQKETIVLERSHCMSCGYRLSWYDMVPVVSWLALRGRCRKCKARISAQYPLVEACNGILYVAVFLANGINWTSVLYCFLVSALLVLSVIDWRTYEIPLGINIFILVLGLIHLALDHGNWTSYVIGFLAISVPLYILFQVSGGRAIGGGDIKLMAAAGLLLGWKLIILAFLVGCMIGSVIHIIRMRVAGADRMLAMGPYLSLGILLAILWGDTWIQAYLSLFSL